MLLGMFSARQVIAMLIEEMHDPARWVLASTDCTRHIPPCLSASPITCKRDKIKILYVDSARYISSVKSYHKFSLAQAS